MHITTVTYERRISDGNFGNRTIQLIAHLDEADDPLAALASLRTTAHTQLVRDADEEEQERQRRAEEQARRYRAAHPDPTEAGSQRHTPPVPPTAPIGTGDGALEGLQ